MKPLECFSKHPRGKYGRQPKCKDCCKRYADSYYPANKQKWVDREAKARETDPEALKKKNRDAATKWRSNPENVRNKKIAYIENRYGISIEDYERMETEQGGLCKICKGPPGGRYNRLHVDHSHATGRVRGLLCFTCNAGLGFFQDSSDKLRAAIGYLDSVSI